MTLSKRLFLSLILSCIISVLSYLFINFFIVKISILKFIFIEFILLGSKKLFKFTDSKLDKPIR